MNIKVTLSKLNNEWKKSKIRCKLRKFLIERSFSRGDMIIFLIIMIIGTVLYREIASQIFFICSTGTSFLLGRLGMKKLRYILEKAENIVESPNVPITKKYSEAVQAIHKGCDQLGRVMDRFNLEQGTAPYLKDLEKPLNQDNELK